MSQSASKEQIDFSQFKSGLIFDAEGIRLFGKFEDELSAWRAKKIWKEVLHDYFLLEIERDYEVTIISKLSNKIFCIEANFISACGRYAFWRLINNQAPEVEDKLEGLFPETSKNSENKLRNTAKSTLAEDWINDNIEDTLSNNKQSSKLLNKIMCLFTSSTDKS